MIRSHRNAAFVCDHLYKASLTSLCEEHCRPMSSQARSKTQQAGQPVHWFRNLFPWKSPEDVAEMLKKNIIYEDGDLVAFNKPFDLPMHSLKYNEHSTIAMDPRLGDVSVKAALPLLKKAFNLEQALVPIFSQHRCSSGVMVMAKTKKAVEFYARNFNMNRTNKVKHQKYCALTLGIPDEKTDMNVYMTKNPPTSPLKADISLRRPSQRLRQGPMAHGRITTALLDCHVLAESRALPQVHVAAVELNTSASNWELLAAYCVESLCPVLGEYNHAARIKTVLGKPILVKHVDQSQEVPPLHALLCLHLGISEKESLYIPTHLHCFELTLRDMSKPKHGQIHIQAPLPRFFASSLERLQLNLPDDHLLSVIPQQGRVLRNVVRRQSREQNNDRRETQETTDRSSHD